MKPKSLTAGSDMGMRSLKFSIQHSAFIILWLLVGCGGTAPVVKIGLIAPFEGQSRAIGYDAIYSARLAVREINAAGGIGGYRVALVALDDSGSPEFAAQTAVSLIIDPAVVAVIGHGLEQTTAVAAPLYADANLPFLPLNVAEATAVPPDFYARYTAVTPFDEEPGEYALPTYQAMWTIFAGMETAVAQNSTISRTTLQTALNE